jgi:hypothetical protein
MRNPPVHTNGSLGRLNREQRNEEDIMDVINHALEIVALWFILFLIVAGAFALAQELLPIMLQ